MCSSSVGWSKRAKAITTDAIPAFGYTGSSLRTRRGDRTRAPRVPQESCRNKPSQEESTRGLSRCEKKLRFYSLSKVFHPLYYGIKPIAKTVYIECWYVYKQFSILISCH